ncbi:MAG: hypothetical protein MZV70_12825 [Desulfobacterales bacterium]|nr:hypothetical protein [Desulfobacterales bacterium]
MGGLIQWLAANRDEETPRREEHQLRLESDADAVRGRYDPQEQGARMPRRLLPLQLGALPRGQRCLRLPRRGGRLAAQRGPGARRARKPCRAAEREQLAENVRLLMLVSVTRAKNRCYLVWGPINRAQTSSLAYILHPPEGGLGSVVDETAAQGSWRWTKTSSASGTWRESPRPRPGPSRLQPAARGAKVALVEAPCRRGRSLLEARDFRREVGRAFEIASFSLPRRGGGPGSWRRARALSELPDHDERTPGRAAREPVDAVGHLCLSPRAEGREVPPRHCPSASISPAPNGVPSRRSSARRLRRPAAHEQSWCDTLCDMIGRVLEAPLDRGGGIRPLRLGRRRCPHELSFSFPPRGPYPGEAPAALLPVQDVLQDGVPQRIGTLSVSTRSRASRKCCTDLKVS